MQPELVFRAITHSMIGVAIMTLLLVLLIGLVKELLGGEPIRGMVHLGIIVIGLFIFLALMVALFQARKAIVPETISHRMDTAGIGQAKRTVASDFSPDFSASARASR
jgi:Na+/melibiose symporter-like transporter